MFFRFISFLALSLLSCSVTPVPEANVSGVEAFQTTFRKTSIDVVKINPEQQQIQFYYLDQLGVPYRNFSHLNTALKQSLAFAMNGGMYLKDGSPQGLFIEKGQTITPLDTVQEAYGNFYLQPNGVFYLQGKDAHVISTIDYLKTKPSPEYATQSGPMLVIDSKIHPVFREGSDNLNIRNGVGVDQNGIVCFAISNKEINLYDFALFFKDVLKCPNALYLDGFVSRAYIPALNRLEDDGNFGVMIGVSLTSE